MTAFWNFFDFKRRRPKYFFISVVVCILADICVGVPNNTVDNLEGQAGFRMASLRWKYPNIKKGPTAFRVRFCELHPWGLHRCRYQTVDEAVARSGRQESTQLKEEEDFIVDIGGLRMATNYSFQVIPQDSIHKFGGKPSQIALQTKGFAAKATKCLADSSEVVVETGPFFGGRVSVEDSTIPGCFVKGNSQSSQTKYTLRIRHKECGSIIDGSKVTSVIVVQENIPILTHSTRRFVVVCSFSPDSFIVKAGVTLPRETSVAKSIDFSQFIRIAPQASNVLNGGEPVSDSVPEGRGEVSPADPSNSNTVSLFSANDQANSIASFSSLQEGSPYIVSRLQADPSADSSRAFNEKLQRGTWETFLVFGMICAAIIASMSSVIWFIKSYRNSGDESNQHRLRHGDEDSSSSDSNLSYSSFDGSISLSSDQGNPNNQDNRSDIDVELDFEFSEDINPPTHEYANNCSQVTFSRPTAEQSQSHS